MDNCPWLILVVILPLTGAVITPIIGFLSRRAAWFWSLAVMGFTSMAGLALIQRVAAEGPFSYHPGGWPPPWGIELHFDEFGALIGIVCILGFLAILFSGRYLEKTVPSPRIPYFYTLMLLNLGGMIGFMITGDLFNLFVFMEIFSLSSYALVAISGERMSEQAAFKYLIMGAISSLWTLLAIGFLYSLTGTLNMSDMAGRLGEGVSVLPAKLAFISLILSFSVKAALFPLHVWLPDAHSIAPSPVSAILSGLVVKGGILGILRTYQIFYRARVIDTASLNTLLCWLGAVSIVMGAFFAIFQEDIKMMLAYSTISNIGYIFMGLGLGSRYGMIGAVVHVFNHAMIKAVLFLGAGALIYQTGYRRLKDLRGVGRAMPYTAAAMTIGAVSIVGIPPTAGFICKWYITLGAVEANKPFFAVALVFGALFIFIYYIRMVNIFYFREPTHPEILEVGEAPTSMLIPVLALALLCLIMGILGRIPLSFIEPAVVRLLSSGGG